jgi:cytochrome P450
MMSGSSRGLPGLTVVPKKLAMPLRRTGLDPVPALGQRREVDPVVKLARVLGMNVWLVSGYAQARSVLADTDNFSSDIRSLAGESASSIGGLGFTDPPEHTRLRKLLTPEFTGRRLAALRPRIDEIIVERLEAMAAQGPVVDFVTEFAFPVPFKVICELLGLPVEDQERFRALGQTRFDVGGGSHSTFGAMSESRALLREAISRQRRVPGRGLIGALIEAAGDDVDEDEFAGLVDGVFIGGYETSASMLALGTLALLQDRDQFERAAFGGAALDATVEELLRYLSVVQIAFPRFARHELALFGKNIKAGDVVVCSLSGANRDAAFGDGADRFDPARPSQPHLAFGHGFHRCLGAELARMELHLAFHHLARRFPDLALAADPSKLSFRDLSIVYGIDALPVLLGDGRSS